MFNDIFVALWNLFAWVCAFAAVGVAIGALVVGMYGLFLFFAIFTIILVLCRW